jgi:hypothetical protein
VLALCARAGLVSLGVVAIDSTKLAANASGDASRSYEQIAAELLGEAEAIDEAEDQQFGQARGDELPREMADPVSRRARLQEAKRQMEAEHEAAKDAHRERLERRAELERELGRRFAGRPPKAPPEEIPSSTRVNITDRDSRSVKTRKGFIQGYNAQAAATSEQIIIAAEIIGNGVDYGLLEPVTDAAVSELAAAGIDGQIDVLLADAGYWASEQIENLAARGIQPLVPPDGQNPRGSARTAKGHAMTSCATSSPATTDASYTASENTRSSRSLARSSTTDASTDSSGEASPHADRSGDSSPPPTTSSSSGRRTTPPQPPEHHRQRSRPPHRAKPAHAGRNRAHTPPKN